jgi:hypothetical protein
MPTLLNAAASVTFRIFTDKIEGLREAVACLYLRPEPTSEHLETDDEIVTEDDIFSFARNKIRSAWALELVLVLRRDRTRSWSVADLVRELRSSEAVIVPCLDTLKSEGRVDGRTGEGFRYHPASEELDAACGELAKLYASRPMALAKAIMKVPNEKLSIFSNAFKIKD